MLTAVLLNPPTGSGAATRRQLAVAARILGCEGVEIANLYARPTAGVDELNVLGREHEGWLEAEASLRTAISTAEQLIVGWGVSGLRGEALRHMRGQVEWFSASLSAVGAATPWSVGGQPRHPSRWHQYVSDRPGRTLGGEFEERIRQVLTQGTCPERAAAR